MLEDDSLHCFGGDALIEKDFGYESTEVHDHDVVLRFGYVHGGTFVYSGLHELNTEIVSSVDVLNTDFLNDIT